MNPKTQIHSILQSCKERNQKVIYVGHSLGCLLGLPESLEEETCIDSRFLLNVPLHAKLGFTTIKQCMKCAFGKEENHTEMTHSFKGSCSIGISKNLFSYIGWLPGFMDLFRIMNETKRRLLSLKLSRRSATIPERMNSLERRL